MSSLSPQPSSILWITPRRARRFHTFQDPLYLYFVLEYSAGPSPHRLSCTAQTARVAGARLIPPVPPLPLRCKCRAGCAHLCELTFACGGAGGELFSVIRKAHRLPNDTAQVPPTSAFRNGSAGQRSGVLAT